MEADVNTPEPGSPEEAAARRNVGKGPFAAGKCQVHDETPGVYDGAAVFDAEGQPFCLIASDDCVGGDLSAAKARATRIAESLNLTEGYDQEAKARLLVRLPDQRIAMNPDLGPQEALVDVGPELWESVVRARFVNPEDIR
jgi:hypothetical protein